MDNYNERKVLMLCGGDLRSLKFAEYLRQYNWQGIMILSKNPFLVGEYKLYHNKLKNVLIVKTWDILPFMGIISGILRRIKMNTQLIALPDIFIGWIPHTFVKSLEILNKQNIDIIYVSCFPYSGALVGTYLKKISKKPLVIDLRDPWTLSEYLNYPTLVHKLLNKKLESWALRSADLVMVVSETMKRDYISAYPWIKNKIKVIPNGFDFENYDINKVKVNLSDKLSISYVGGIYGIRYKPLDLFFRGLSNIIIKKLIDINKIQVFLVGSKRKEVDYLINKYNLSDTVISTSMLPQSEAIDYIFKSKVLLLLESSASITTKVFEYLATGKPIFAVIKKGELEKIIETYSDNSYIITSGNVSDIENALVNVYEKWKLNNLEYTSEPKLKKYCQKYHRRCLTSELVNIFNCFVSGK